SSHLPKTAADSPRKTMAMLNTHPTVARVQSPGAECVMPSWRVSGMLKTLKAYACPTERCIASAAGGTRHRSYPGGAIVCLRSRNDRIDKRTPHHRLELLSAQFLQAHAVDMTQCTLGL